MNRTRIVRLNPPEPCGGIKPAAKVTDRALRYRSHHPDCLPAGAKACAWCGEKKNPQVGHIDGDETNTTPENLIWTCRPCNAKVAIAMKRAGVGRRTKQYNPAKTEGASSRGQYAWALSVMRGDQEGDVQAAADMVQLTPPTKRSRWNEDFWKVRKQRYGPSGRRDGGALPF